MRPVKPMAFWKKNVINEWRKTSFVVVDVFFSMTHVVTQVWKIKHTDDQKCLRQTVQPLHLSLYKKKKACCALWGIAWPWRGQQWTDKHTRKHQLADWFINCCGTRDQGWIAACHSTTAAQDSADVLLRACPSGSSDKRPQRRFWWTHSYDQTQPPRANTLPATYDFSSCLKWFAVAPFWCQNWSQMFRWISYNHIGMHQHWHVKVTHECIVFKYMHYATKFRHHVYTSSCRLKGFCRCFCLCDP